MYRVVALLTAALALAACSENQLPTSTSADLHNPRSIISTTGVIDFESELSGSGEFTPFKTDAFPSTSTFTYTAGGQRFLGRFGAQTDLGPSDRVEFAAGPGSSFTLNFDLYIIGSWDGSGKLKKFGNDQWQVAYYCGASESALTSIFLTDFSNQKTTPQHYPDQVDGALHDPMSGAVSTNSLGYDGSDLTRFHNGDASGASAVYHMSLPVNTSSCGTESVTFVFQTPNSLQSLDDESWGVDNVEVIRNT